MTETAIEIRPEAPELTPFEVMERVISSGDIGQMDPQARVAFYWRTCESLGLNPLTRPFQYLNLNGKIILYATKDATEQLRRVNRVSVTSLVRDRDESLGIFTVTAHGRLLDGREDEATGAVNIKGLSGESLANATMKAETKAKRRLTLSLVGLGFLDESEIEGIGERVNVDATTGEILAAPKPTLLDAVRHQAEILTQPDEEPQADALPKSVETEEPEQAIDEPEDVDEGTFMAEPMTPEASAAVSPVDDLVEEIADEAGLGDDDYPDAASATAEAPGLTIQALADLARAAKVGKQRFATALDVVPADIGPLIETMTDEQRWALALNLGLVG